MKANRPAGTICLQAAAGVLKRRGFETGSKAIFEQLRAMGLLDGCRANAKALRENLLREANGHFEYGFDNSRSYTRVFLTRKGFNALEDHMRAAKNRLDEIVNIELGNGNEGSLGL